MMKEERIDLEKQQIEALRLMVNKGKTFTNREYRKNFNVSSRTALRELSGLVNKGQISEKGRFKDKVYFYGAYKEKMAGKKFLKIIDKKLVKMSGRGRYTYYELS